MGGYANHEPAKCEQLTIGNSPIRSISGGKSRLPNGTRTTTIRRGGPIVEFDTGEGSKRCRGRRDSARQAAIASLPRSRCC